GPADEELAHAELETVGAGHEVGDDHGVGDRIEPGPQAHDVGAGTQRYSGRAHGSQNDFVVARTRVDDVVDAEAVELEGVVAAAPVQRDRLVRAHPAPD